MHARNFRARHRHLLWKRPWTLSVASLSRQPTRQLTDVSSLPLAKLLGDRELKDVVNPRLFAL